MANVHQIISSREGANLILSDGPPGTGCSAISSITGTDAVLLIFEASRSSLHDAQRLIELVRRFDIPLYAIINKFDMHLETSREIESFLSGESIPLLCRIPFDEAVVKAMVSGQSIPEYDPDSYLSQMFSNARNKLIQEIEVLE